MGLFSELLWFQKSVEKIQEKPSRASGAQNVVHGQVPFDLVLELVTSLRERPAEREEDESGAYIQEIKHA